MEITSPGVRDHSGFALCSIPKNGIRLSGLPGFGEVESDDHIYILVYHIRVLAGRENSRRGGNLK